MTHGAVAAGALPAHTRNRTFAAPLQASKELAQTAIKALVEEISQSIAAADGKKPKKVTVAGVGSFTAEMTVAPKTKDATWVVAFKEAAPK